METAGSVIIQISASTDAFEAALAKARQQATAFDAQISAKLSGAGMSAGLAKIAGLIEANTAMLSKLVGAASPAAASLEKVAAATKSTTAALEGLSVAQMETKANFSVMGTQAQQYESALVQVNDANRIGVELEKQRATLAQGTIGTLTGTAGAAKAVAAETAHVASASRLGAAQMAALGHSARSAIETIALGVSPFQALTQQANHLSFAMSGPQGLIAATAGARAGFVEFLGTAAGITTTAGIAAVTGLAAYVLATRNSIQSVDQVLAEHKALIDEIAGAYPEAAKAAKQYEEVASKLPQSVAAADIQDKIKENTRTLNDLLGSLGTRMEMLAQEWGLVGSAGQKAFSDLAQIAKSGAPDAADKIQVALGRMRIDPALNQNAQDLAKALQDDATQAAKLQDALNEKNTFKGIVEDNKRASQSLFAISGSLDTVKASAGGANDAIGKMFGTLNSGGTGQFGVERSLQSTLAGFQQVDNAVQEARRNQLSGFLDLDNQLRATREQADALKQAIATAAGPDNVKLFFNDVSNIANANSELQRSVDTVNRLFDALNTGNATTRSVFEGLDMIRQTLIRDGFGVDQVNNFLDSLVRTRMQLDADTAGAKQLNAAIQAIRDRVINVTVVTRRIGTGTQSIYDVRGSNGGSSSVGVTRYGAAADQSSGPSVSAYSVPTESGYGSQGGTGSGSSSVTVTRFGGTRAEGGPVMPGLPYWVGERGPELVVPSGAGTVVPNAQSLSLAPGLGGKNDDAMTVWDAIQANTLKTTQLLDDIKTAIASSGASSAFSGSSYSGGSSSGVDTSQQAQLSAQYDQVLKQIQANFQAAGIVGRGIIGYGLDGLAATPQEIARNIVYGGAKPTGFATGGMMGPGGGDTQKVEFFKAPNERVIIARPDQFTDARSQPKASQPAERPINVTINQTHNWTGGAPSKDSIAEIRRQTALAIREGLRSINGR